jgi:hypothetical protein
MDEYVCQTPVIFMVFNRPEATEKVFRTIRAVQPPKLLVIADGSRTNHPDDVEKCTAVRKIIDSVDWDCEVIKEYAEVNMGTRLRGSSGLTWAFNTQVEEAIILEDDCLPHPTFFQYCEDLLNYYRHDERVLTISGDNSPLGYQRTADSYFFSRYPRIWGWATWRRAWKYYDLEMKLWPEVRDGNWLADILEEPEDVKFWKKIFQITYDGYECWDYQWIFASFLQNGLNIISNQNLISNIGFGVQATHTFGEDSPRADLPTWDMKFPLKHPPIMVRDARADRFIVRNAFYWSTRLQRAKSRARKALKTILSR